MLFSAGSPVVYDYDGNLRFSGWTQAPRVVQKDRD